MTIFEYKVTPAPLPKGRTAHRAANLAQQLEVDLNAQAEDGWDFVRLDVVTQITKRWFLRNKSTLQTVIVFRREKCEPLPQLVLGARDAVRAPQISAAEPDVVAAEAPDPIKEPPRIENAVRGFGPRGAAPDKSSPPKERPPLVAARRG